MKKIILSASLYFFVTLPVMAVDLEKPPEFKPSAETIERSQRDQAIQAKEKMEAEREKAELLFPDGHDPRDHDHDDAADLDHSHDDPQAHEKQLEELSKQGVEEKSSWWKFW